MGACCPTCGAPAPNPIQGPRNSVVLKPGPRPQAFAVPSRDYPIELTAYRETDAHTALARGIAEYLGQQSIEIGGRRSQLTTFSQWAEPEDNVRYPALAVGAGQGTYVRGFTPDGYIKFDDGTQLEVITEFTQTLTLELWATDPRERAALVAMIESQLNPHSWQYGLRLVLPFYHRTSATYELVSTTYMDSAEDAVAKFRKVNFSVDASITVYRLTQLPLAQRPRLELDVATSGMVFSQSV
jgi:hypothetical protein